VNPALNSYLRMLAGPVDGRARRWLDVRWPEPSSPSGMGREFLPAAAIDQAGLLIERVARHVDVYIGVALHDREAGDGTSVSRSHLVWADIDREDAQASLQSFAHPPTMTVASGTPGRRHSYWLLGGAVDIDEVMTANRQLAGALGGDLSSGLSRVSMLRPPGTYNYKHQPRQPVRIVDLAGSRVYDLAQLVDDLSDPKPPKPPYVPALGPVAGIRLENPTIEIAHAALKTLDAREWMPRLTGVELSAGGYMPCPFHALSVGEATAGGVLPARSLADASSNDRVWRDPLLLVPPPVYFERLTGLRVGRSGKLRCLFHDDEHPSLHVYPEAGRGWYCFGCGRGGSVYDLAALLSGRKTRGADFVELRRELEELLL
jgi:hypothetical protein